MKSVTKYEAKDGVEFTSEKECLSYELLIDEVNDIMNRLPKKPNDDGCSFANGGGFIQHNDSVVNKVKYDLLKVVERYIDHKWVKQTMEDENVHLSYVGRLIDDYNIRPLNAAWSRLMCIDKLYREWGQPYFAINQDKGEQVCLNAQ